MQTTLAFLSKNQSPGDLATDAAFQVLQHVTPCHRHGPGHLLCLVFLFVLTMASDPAITDLPPPVTASAADHLLSTEELSFIVS